MIAGFMHGGPRWGLWTAAFVLHWATRAITAVGGFRIRAAHFVERHGLIVLIALGESVVAVGIGLQDRDLTSGLVVTALLGLLVVAGLWWLYFDGEDARAERALDEATAERNPWPSLFAFGYAFLPLLGSRGMGSSEPGTEKNSNRVFSIRGRNRSMMLRCGSFPAKALSAPSVSHTEKVQNVLASSWALSV
ncbi:MAG TPA: low temperature requirement protein A [Acidimicrobiales bacterium]